mmetsp:Transcript_26937/g.38220  ORF Transcript_26937/g.38220 Transcript_26937/m.38220 type:complete len:187 (+) Transcript_26937:121-681(+)
MVLFNAPSVTTSCGATFYDASDHPDCPVITTGIAGAQVQNLANLPRKEFHNHLCTSAASITFTLNGFHRHPPTMPTASSTHPFCPEPLPTTRPNTGTSLPSSQQEPLVPRTQPIVHATRTTSFSGYADSITFTLNSFHRHLPTMPTSSWLFRGLILWYGTCATRMKILCELHVLGVVNYSKRGTSV